MKENFKTAKISGNFAIVNLKNSHNLKLKLMFYSSEILELKPTRQHVKPALRELL